MSEVAGEGGFEVGRGYLAVFPDATDFASALDEQLGGISVSVMVVPDASDFGDALGEQVGGLSATVQVTPDASDFASAVDEQTGGLTATVTLQVDTEGAADFGDAVSEQAGTVAVPVMVVPDVSDFGDLVGEETGGTVVPVDVVPDTSDFADALGEQVGDLTVKVGVEPDAADFAEAALSGATLGALPVRVVPDPKSLANFGSAVEEGVSRAVVTVGVAPGMSGFAEAVQEQANGTDITVPVTANASDLAASIEDQVGGDGIVIPVTADTSDAVEGMQELQAAEADAAASASQLSVIGETAESADSGIETLYNGILSIGPAATQAEMEAVDALGGIRGAAASVDADAVTEEFAAIGPAAQSAAAQASSAFGETGEAAQSAADGGIEWLHNGILGIGAAATEAEAQAADAMTRIGTMGASVDYGPLTEGLNSADEAVAGLARDTPAATDAASGFSGVLGELGQRLSYFAVDPFMWMYAAPVVIDGVATAIKYLTSSSSDWITALQKQDDATGYDISGYQKLSDQLSSMISPYGQNVAAVESLQQHTAMVGQALGDYMTRNKEMTAAQQEAITIIDNLTGHVGTLEEKYGISATQAEDLATAAGVSYKQLEGSGDAADKAMAKIEAYANANLSATGPVSELADDVSVFGNDALTASARVSALTDSYNLLVGNFVSAQTDMLSVRQDFLGIESAASIAGASMDGTNTQSVSLQQSFYATAGAIQQTAQAMLNAKDPTSEITAYIQEQTDKLSGLTGGNQQAQQAVEGLREWEDRLTSSVDATDRAVNQASTDLQSKFITQLDAAGAKSKTVTGGVNELADSILATGTRSDETAADRAQLIKDLEQAGINAQKATTLVDAFIKKIGQIPAHVSLSLTETATGTWSIEGSAAAGTAEATHAGGGDTRFVQSAGGGHITSGSKIPRADDVHAMLSRNEYVVQSDAVDHYGVGFLDSVNAMHFAGGGYAGDLSGLAGFIGAGYLSTANTLTQAIEAAVTAAIAAAKDSSTSDKPPVIVNFNGTQYPTPSQRQALMMELAAAIGVS